ncbi:hypothetical protein SVIOM74S_04817 [Streptomyces violarus]
MLARAGFGSRRACEELIDEARVEVNGEIVLEQGRRVDPEKDEIKVDGLTVATQSYQFFALNKPAGVVSTMEDPEGRQCLGDYVTNRETRLFHVARHRGRLGLHRLPGRRLRRRVPGCGGVAGRVGRPRRVPERPADPRRLWDA